MKLSVQTIRCAAGELQTSKREWPAQLGLYLLQAYFLTGIIANYHGLHYLNDAFLIMAALFALMSAKRSKLKGSPLLLLYALLTLISLISHAMLLLETGELPAGAGTMPIVFAGMLACRCLAIPGLFRRVVTLNVIPVAALLLIGGVDFSDGRLQTQYLNEYQHGWFPQFGFAVGVASLLQGRFPVLVMVSFLTSGLFMTLTSSRHHFVFLACAFAVLVFWNIHDRSFRITRLLQRPHASRRIMVTAVLLITGLFVILPRMTTNARERFGESFSWGEHVGEILLGEATDRSSFERSAFIDASLVAVQEHWLGVGNANFPYVAARYGIIGISLAGHPHSGFADALITGGYPGLIIYLLMLLHLFRIGRKDLTMSICLVWLFLMISLASNLADKILWPMMAIAERELQQSKVKISQCSQAVSADRIGRIVPRRKWIRVQ